jgi:hypothetical protein
MATAALGHWSSCVLRSRKDPTGCGSWSYICLGKNDKKFAIVTVYRIGNNRNLGDATACQQQYRTQYDDETARVDTNPHKQKIMYLEYFTEELKADGFEVVVFVEENEPIDHSVRTNLPQCT